MHHNLTTNRTERPMTDPRNASAVPAVRPAQAGRADNAILHAGSEPSPSKPPSLTLSEDEVREGAGGYRNAAFHCLHWCPHTRRRRVKRRRDI